MVVVATVVVVVATVVVVVATVVVVVATVVVVVATVVVVVATVVVVVATVVVVVPPAHESGAHVPGPMLMPPCLVHLLAGSSLHPTFGRQQRLRAASAARTGPAIITAVATAKVTRPRLIKARVMGTSLAVASVGEALP